MARGFRIGLIVLLLAGGLAAAMSYGAGAAGQVEVRQLGVERVNEILQCAPDEGVSFFIAEWPPDTKLPTARRALEALLQGSGHPASPAAFAVESVVLTDGVKELAAREFTLKVDARIQATTQAFAVDDGWLATNLYRCYKPLPDEVEDMG